ncbi:hypothetical protein [Pseudomonas syringae]|uniref:Uncharacterized protein n=1 Tax=Pseudomonas syringae TaxID=317 RepID=A0A9Q4A7R8_PSESX|nr:hypothetical protein [Pseudomonas syringae]MCF5468269.1 hypothetical protein [Pseudomonas syringae]MCF5472951.1 hypothetical protein [Pseudomonas syringae]MCF5482966.1 hypothetical protein [Pseudomonas syringae]MCF5490808.1 hypothetical protein [Pseudomonas syringae]MCF5495595.1 hypothetical protein [Pseudomonas syringae]
MGTNTKTTSASVAHLASETLRSSGTSAIAKSLAASVLAQASSGKQTGERMEHIAGNVLQSDKYSQTSKALAASLVSQSPKR